LGTSVFNVGTNNLDTEFTGSYTTTGTGTFGVVGNGYIVKEGTGTLTLGGFVSNASGRIVVETGTLVLDKANGSSAVNALTASLGVIALEVKGGATVRLAGAGDAQLSPNADVILHTNATMDMNGRSLTINRLTGAGVVTNGLVNTSIELTIGNGGTATTHDFTFGGVVENGLGKIALVKRGTSLLTLAQVQSYTGETRIEAGSLILTRSNQLSPGSSLNVVISTAKLVMDDNSLVVSNLRGAGAVELGAGVLTVNSTSDGSFTGVLSGSGGLVKSGAGTLTLAGTDTYTGTTSVLAGTLNFGAGAAYTWSRTSEIAISAQAKARIDV
jgi:autotransporter-associated beta strand protein